MDVAQLVRMNTVEMVQYSQTYSFPLQECEKHVMMEIQQDEMDVV